MDIMAKLVAVRGEIEISIPRLRDEFVAQAGYRSTRTIERWMSGETTISAPDYGILAPIINDHLELIGKKRLLPEFQPSFSFAAWDAAAPAAESDGASLVTTSRPRYALA